MLEQDWSRTYINRQVLRIAHVFKWAAGEQILPASVHDQLVKVEGLRKGKTSARETSKVRPVAVEDVDVSLTFMQPTVQAMVRLQLLTGCRPAEICLLRPMDLDMKNPACWVYRPGSDMRSTFFVPIIPLRTVPSALGFQKHGGDKMVSEQLLAEITNGEGEPL